MDSLPWFVADNSEFVGAENAGNTREEAIEWGREIYDGEFWVAPAIEEYDPEVASWFLGESEHVEATE